MILGVGTDIVSVERIENVFEKHGERFASKYFSAVEIEKAESFTVGKMNVYAKRWAAKEALAKALGTGFRNKISMKDISIVNDENGKPSFELSGGVKEELEKFIPAGMNAKVSLSMSDEIAMAVAFVVISAEME